MSNWRDRVDEESGVGVATAWLGAYYHYLTLALLAGFALWNRVRFWQNFVVGGEVLFRANDPWYHLRNVQYVVDNYPATMAFDPWTYFSFGTANAQFGTLFDQLMATMAMIVGLGDPSNELVRMVVLFAPAVFGVAVMIPAYLIGRHLGGRAGGLIGATVIAFGSGSLLSSSVAGASDHHVAEALFQAVAVLGVMTALSVTRAEKPVWELVTDREFGVLRDSLAWSTLGGVAVAAYLWVWPPGVVLVGILGLFALIHLSAEYLRGRSPEHAAFALTVALGVAGVLQLGTVEVFDISATDRTLLQPGIAFAVAATAVFLAWLARVWDARDQPTALFPVAVGGIVAAVGVAIAVGLPDVFGFFVNQLDRVFGFFTASISGRGTVGEAQPGSLGQFVDAYSLAAVTALFGGIVLLARQFLDEDAGGEGLLVLLWTVAMVSASLTQARFQYYMAVPVGALNAVLVGEIARRLGPVDPGLDVEPYEILTVSAVVILVVAPMALGLGGASATAVASAASNPGGIVGWQSSLDYLNESTPQEGQYANPDGEQLDFYGTFARTDDYDYGEGAYGVMSWWDYGHWITQQGGRIPNANPFQQGNVDAARFLLAENESEARGVLADFDENDAHTRYVMIDWKMAETESLSPVRGKFFAPPTFAPNVTKSDYYSRIVNRSQLQQSGLIRSTVTMRHKQAYYETLMTRLYSFHGSAVEPAPYVLDWRGGERPLTTGGTFSFAPQDGQVLKTFGNVSAARAFVAEDGSAQLGGIGPYPSERVPALEHYRLVQMSSTSSLESRAYLFGVRRTIRQAGVGRIAQQRAGNVSQAQLQQQAVGFLFRTTPAWTKVFQRVPGATVEGTGPPNATVRMSVQMRPRNGSPFRYTQAVETGPDGSFTTTVPYSTTGYGNWGPAEGHTNVSVRAAGPYRLQTSARFNESRYLVRSSATLNVSEAAVIGEDPDPIQVTLQNQVLGSPQQDNQTDDGTRNGTEGPSPEATDATSGTDSATTGTDGTDGSNATGARTAEPAVPAE